MQTKSGFCSTNHNYYNGHHYTRYCLIFRCCSAVGRITGYIQVLSFGRTCGFSEAVHEIGHVIGFWHEQSRADRNDYINVHYNNIEPGALLNFAILKNSNSLGVTYDFNSIMHYDEVAFSINGEKTMSSKEPNIPLGRSTGLSPLDIQQTQLLYEDLCSKLLL